MTQATPSSMNDHTLSRTPCSTRAFAILVVGAMQVVLTGCATAHGPRLADDRVMTGVWSRVGELRPGARVAVATTNLPSRAGIFVSADPSGVTVLRLELPSVPQAAIHSLRDMATRHPESFVAMQGGDSFEQDGVRLGRDGLFVANRRVAAFAQVVETVPREAVREIRGPVVARGSVLGPIVGGWVGFSVGVVPALGGADAGAARAFLAGAVALGGWLGNRWSNHTVDDVVYRAP